MQDFRVNNFFSQYIKTNYREYILLGLLFIIGLFIGVFIINNCPDTQASEISTYISNFIRGLKATNDINNRSLVISSIKNNIFFAVILWMAGTTVIGIPVVLAVILFRGVVLGYTIASFTFILGTAKGILFCLAAILLQNIVFIPAILTLGVSSINLYKSIIKDKKKENIKSEVIKHTVILILTIAGLVLSSIIENTVSITILKKIIKYF